MVTLLFQTGSAQVDTEGDSIAILNTEEVVYETREWGKSAT